MFAGPSNVGSLLIFPAHLLTYHFLFLQRYLTYLADGKAYDRFRWRLWRNIATSLGCNVEDLDIPQHYELWLFWGDVKISKGKDVTGLEAFVHLAQSLGVCGTASADCERVFSIFKRALNLEGGQGFASPQLQAAAVQRRFNMDPEDMAVLNRYKKNGVPSGEEIWSPTATTP